MKELPAQLYSKHLNNTPTVTQRDSLTFNQNGNIVSKNRSSAQAEQCYSTDIFRRNLVGVEIMKPGMKEVQTSYYDYGLKNMEEHIPTPEGNITINWNLAVKGGSLHITHPKTVKVVLNKRTFPSGLSISQKTY